jgi:hypothetical protein
MLRGKSRPNTVSSGAGLGDQVEQMRLYLSAWLRQCRETLAQSAGSGGARTPTTPVSSDLRAEDGDDEIFGDL